MALPIDKIYKNTVKFNYHGKIVEIKFCNGNDSNRLIQTGIYDEKFKSTYLVEPAFDTTKTIITVFNEPLGASGNCVQQYLE